MDDETGWNEVLVDGWNDRVRDASAARVEDALVACPGVLVLAVTEGDAADPDWVERTHAAVVEAIRAETGADLDHLGSQSAWRTYDEVWEALARRSDRLVVGEAVPDHAVRRVVELLRSLPRAAVERSGAAQRSDGRVRLVARAGVPHLDVEGLFAWLATEVGADQTVREHAREVVALVRSPAP